MKDIRAALHAFLLQDATISGLVGGVRIYPAILPQGVAVAVTPAIVQNLITEDTDYHMQGASGLATVRVQLDCWATTHGAAVALANLVKDHLSGHSGTISYGSESPQQQVVVQGIFADQGRDDYDATAKLFSRRRDYTIWYREN